jgi:hypothetical protein
MFEIRSKKKIEPEERLITEPKVESPQESNHLPQSEGSLISIFGSLREIHEGDYLATILVSDNSIQIISTNKVAKQ